MKKLLFVLVFAFIGHQSFSQIYLVTISHDYNINSCSSNYERTLTKVTAAGVETHDCIPSSIEDGALTVLNAELNSITSQGYKLIETSYDQNSNGGGGLIDDTGNLNRSMAFIFAIP